MLRRGIRSFSISIGTCQKAKVSQEVLSRDEISKLLNTPTWKVGDLMKTTEEDIQDVKVDSSIIRKMLKLSGLKEDVSPERETELIRALKLQMGFIKKLYGTGEEMSVRGKKSNDTNFRLMAEDHKPDTPLTLDILLAEIDALPNKVDPEKGEFTSSIDIKKLRSSNNPLFSSKSIEKV
ncbi:uncharacterized protein RJT21DRAFT_57888 [Scheffersomyces amazonensis]|uniref:uncharacterized protein n=1 Tax=Scheffersomyces amazonensis TaxID=1078765 RepID=UPI00315CF7E2